MEILLSFAFFFLLLVVGGMIGSMRERAHIAELDAYEQAHADFPMSDLRTIPGMADDVSYGVLVMGAAVISTDYLKSFLAGMRNLFGGEVKSFQTLLSRARREARRRMLDEALKVGGHAVVNVRFETSNIVSGGQSKTTAIEVLCYGTVVVRQGAVATPR